MLLADEYFGLARFDDVALLPDSPVIDQQLARFDLDIVGSLRNPVEIVVAEPLEEGQPSQSSGAIHCLFPLPEHISHLSAWTGAPVRDDGRRNPPDPTGGIHGLGTF